MSEHEEPPGPGSPTDAGDVDQDSDPPTSGEPGGEDRSEPPPSEEESHSRPGRDDLPFGDVPQENQGDDPASGGA